MSKLFLMSLYYISFAPLWVSVLFIDIKSIVENSEKVCAETIGVTAILVLSLICLSILFFELFANKKEGTNRYEIKSVKEEKSITAEYLLSYILPLFAFDFTTWEGVILFMIFFVTLGFLCIKHNYFSVNVVLEIMNFGFYACVLENEDNIPVEKLIISRRKLNGCIGDNIYLKAINNDFSLDVEWKSE